MPMSRQNPTITVLGSSGGVAKAIAAILNNSAEDTDDPIHAFIEGCQLHFIDYKQKDLDYFHANYPNLAGKIVLHQFDINDTGKLKKHLLRTQTDLVVDVSWADTVEILACCNELGISYVNTALENTMVDEDEDLEGFTLIERYRIFEQNRNRFANMKAIVCSGMNPGVVQWMAVELMNRTPDETPLACYIVERDNSFYADRTRIEQHTLYSTWSPECFLDEAILNFPMFVKQHEPLFLYTPVYELEFKVKLGAIRFSGCLMPHEEVLTLGKLFNMETGFIYRVNDYTTETMRSNLSNVHDLWDWRHKVLDPADGELEGEDLVGVLLVYKDKERFMYNVKDNKSAFARYGTNATYFQVACGLYGAMSSMLLDDLPTGIFCVDELLLATGSRYGQYVSYYLKDFVTGENDHVDGFILDRKIKIGEVSP